MGADARTVDTDVLRSLIRDIPDFPSPGIVFKDITPLLADADAFRVTVDALADRYADAGVDKVLGIEARGFIAAAPVARRLGVGFVPVRKAGKLPWQVEKDGNCYLEDRRPNANCDPYVVTRLITNTCCAAEA